MNEISRKAARLVYENDFVRVFDDDVVFPSGTAGRYVRVEAVEGDGVVIVARDGDRIALVETYRYPRAETQLALPRGFAHGPSVEDSARAEAMEELGVQLTSPRVIGHVTPDSGLLATRASVILAEVAEKSAAGPLDEDEVSAVHWVTLAELKALVAAGRIEDGFTLAALALLLVGGDSGEPPEPT